MISSRRHPAPWWLVLVGVLLAGCATAEPALPTPLPPVVDTRVPTASRPSPTLMPTTTRPAPTATPTLPPLPAPALPEPLPDEAFAQAMRPGNERDLQALPEVPRYRLGLRVAPEQERLIGRQVLSFTNQEGAPLETILLRLYGNLQQTSEGTIPIPNTRIESLLVNGEPATFEVEASVLTVPLPRPLPPGAAVELEISFASDIGRTASVSAAYWIVAPYYPLLAVHDEDGWRQDVAPNGDLIYSELAHYTVALTLPEGMPVATSGVIVRSESNADGSATHTVLAPAMRHLTLVFGALQHRQEVVDGIRVNLWHVAGDPLVEDKLATVGQAVRFFNQRFGFYPYAELDVVSSALPGAPENAGAGIEYPGLVCHSHGAGGDDHSLVHEVAHQWWFAVVGNDTHREPWLDEALTNYSSYLYFEGVDGPEVGAEMLAREILDDYRLLERTNPARAQAPVGWSVYEFGQEWGYSPVVYGKGVLFFQALREAMGDEAFFAFLQRYYEQHQYGVATGESFLAVAEAVSGQDLAPLYTEWVEGTEDAP